MKQLYQKRLLAVAVLAFVLPVATPSAGHASTRNGEREVATTNTTTTTQSSETEMESHVSDLKLNAQKEVEKQRAAKGKNALSDDKRKLVCENKQNAINNKLSAFTQAADKHLAKMNDVFTKVQTYQTKNNLPVTNYSDLVTAAESKQKVATDAVAALKVVAVNVDCTDPTTVVKLSTVRDAAKAARTALHDYRMSIKDIVTALAHARGDATSDSTDTTDTTGGTQQ